MMDSYTYTPHGTDDPQFSGLLPTTDICQIFLNGKEFQKNGIFFVRSGEDGRIEYYKMDENGRRYLLADNSVASEAVFGVVTVVRKYIHDELLKDIAAGEWK